MHGKVLRGGPGDLSLRLSCITRPTSYISPWSVYTLRTFACRLSTDPVIWRVRPCHSVFLLINIIFLIFLIWLRFLIQIWANMIPCLSVFSVSEYYTLFCYFSGCGPLALSWYSVGSHLYHMSFCHFLGYGCATLFRAPHRPEKRTGGWIAEEGHRDPSKCALGYIYINLECTFKGFRDCGVFKIPMGASPHC
jgi:hypothetical protein